MPHGGYHGSVQGLGQSNKPDTSAYKQAAQSMMSAGISNLSGSTTSDKKGKKAKKIQQTFQNNNNNNNNVDPIVPKPKPKPDEKKKELRLTIPGSDPDKDDRPKTGVTTGANKAKDEGPNIFGNLQYNMDLSQPVTSLMVNEDTITAPKLALQNEVFQFNVEDFVMNNIPESLHDTVGASYAIVKAYVDQGFDFDVGNSGQVTIDWANDLSIKYNLEF